MAYEQPAWRYRLDVRVTMEKTYPDGMGTGERLSVEHQFSVRVEDFLEVCSVLGRFDALAKNIQAEAGTKP